MITRVYIRHKVGRCPICGAPILDAGWTDDLRGWTHAVPACNGRAIKPTPNALGYPVCTMTLHGPDVQL